MKRVEENDHNVSNIIDSSDIGLEAKLADIKAINDWETKHAMKLHNEFNPKYKITADDILPVPYKYDIDGLDTMMK